MSFWNSAIGGFIGFSLGGPLGGLIGAVIGSKIGSKKYANSSLRFTSNQQQQAAFFAALFACLAKLAKADGIVSTEEVDKVDDFIKGLDQPGHDPSSNFLLNDFLNKDGFDSVVCGMGGDAFFASKLKLNLTKKFM